MAINNNQKLAVLIDADKRAGVRHSGTAGRGVALWHGQPRQPAQTPGAMNIPLTVRALAIAPLVGDFTARQIGTFTGCAFIGLIAWTMSRWLNASTRRAQWAVGAPWVVLMMAFEVAFGRLVAGAS